jgi:hypothetical protein
MKTNAEYEVPEVVKQLYLNSRGFDTKEFQWSFKGISLDQLFECVRLSDDEDEIEAAIQVTKTLNNLVKK